MRQKINLLMIAFISILLISSCAKKNDGVNINSVTQDVNESPQKVKISSKTLEEYKDTAYKYLEERDYDKALENFNIVIKMEPNNYNAYMIIAQIYISQNNFEKGINTYKEVIKIDTEGRASIEAYLMLSRAYQSKKQNKLAHNALNEAKKIALKTDPKMVTSIDNKIENLRK